VGVKKLAAARARAPKGVRARNLWEDALPAPAVGGLAQPVCGLVVGAAASSTQWSGSVKHTVTL
jgi:hypothetical protein